MTSEAVSIEMGVLQGTARNMLTGYCTLMDAEYEASPHSLKVVEHLEALERGEIRNLMVMEPPRHGKSYHASERFPAWYLGRHPKNRVILASYAATLAENNSRSVRNLMDDARNPFPVSLQVDSRSIGRWQTKQGGSLLAAGVGGGITGFGGHLLVADDLFAGRAEADSEVVRERTWLWYQEVFRTRRMPGARELSIGTHWHEDDVQGRILNSKGARNWTVLSIPAIAEDGDVLGRTPGEALWPSHFLKREDWEQLTAKEQETVEPLPSVEEGDISARGFAALYQQRPTPAGGGVFRHEWMLRRYSLEHIQMAKMGMRWRVIQTIDLGGKQGTGHDPSAIATWGSDGISKYLLDYWSAQDEYADVKGKAKALYSEWRPRSVFVEDATWAQPLISDLRRESGIAVQPVPAEGSKWTRADAVSPEFESGKVVLPERAPWLEKWDKEMTAFPNGTHDEAVDTTSLALAELRAVGLRLPGRALNGRRLARSAV